MQRAIKRAKLPVWYTEGFNPRLYIQFMLPLSLGQESLREAADFRLLEEIPHSEVTDRLNAALPEDIRVIETTVPVHKNTDVAAAEYEITADMDLKKFREFTEQEQILTEKKTKKGITQVDLKQHLLFVEISDRITLRLPAGNEFNINPTLVLDAFKTQTGESISHLKIMRTKILLENGKEFT